MMCWSGMSSRETGVMALQLCSRQVDPALEGQICHPCLHRSSNSFCGSWGLHESRERMGGRARGETGGSPAAGRLGRHVRNSS